MNLDIKELMCSYLINISLKYQYFIRPIVIYHWTSWNFLPSSFRISHLLSFPFTKRIPEKKILESILHMEGIMIPAFLFAL